MYSNCCCSCSFEPEVMKISQSSHYMYSNNILNFQESTTILNACTKISGNLLKAIWFNWDCVDVALSVDVCPSRRGARSVIILPPAIGK